MRTSSRSFQDSPQYDYPGWAVVAWECCLKHPEQGAQKGATNFARGGANVPLNRIVLGLDGR